MKQNHTNYYENGRRIAVDHKTPIDVLEPESEPAHDIGSDLLTVIESIAATYLRGDPEVTRIAWRFLLNKEPEIHPLLRQSYRLFRCRHQQAGRYFVGAVWAATQQ